MASTATPSALLGHIAKRARATSCRAAALPRSSPSFSRGIGALPSRSGSQSSDGRGGNDSRGGGREAPSLPPRTSRSSPDDLYDIKVLERFGFDDTTSVGHMLLEGQRERLGLLRAIEQDRAVLEQQRVPFTPPNASQAIRIRRIIPLTSTTPLSRKRVLEVPVASLPLADDAALHRFKLLAGARWTPAHGEPRGGVAQGGKEEKRHGWFKMSEESFPEGGMNRQWMIDALRKMVLEANNPTSDILKGSAKDLLPLDTRHVVARQRKKNGRTALERRGGEVVGGVKGFPKAWL